MCLLGKVGFVAVAQQCFAKTEYVKKELAGSGVWELPYDAPTFNEFVARSKKGSVKGLLETLAGEGILAGLDVSRWDGARDRDLLISVTELHTRADLDRLVARLS
jgi:glycine dehydrogenase subunit 1